MKWIEITSDPFTWPPIGKEVVVKVKGLKPSWDQLLKMRRREDEGLGSWDKWREIEPGDFDNMAIMD